MVRSAFAFVLCFFAAAIGGITSAQAAKPVEYVKVCESFGAGYYYVPGTETCLRIGGYVRTEFLGGERGTGKICNGRYFRQSDQNCGRPTGNDEYVKVCSVYGAGFYYIPGTDTCIKIGGWVRVNENTETEFRNDTPMPNSPLNVALIGGAQWSRFSSNYRSTGGQAAFDGNANDTGAEFLAQFKYSSQLGNGVSLSMGFNGGGNFTGRTTLFDIVRHNNPVGAANGHVKFSVDPGAVFEPFVEGRWPINPSTYAWVSPSVLFEHRSLQLTSDQTGFGGAFESKTEDYWAHGWGLRAGISNLVCGNCFLNQPLTLSLGGNAAWFTGSKSVDVRSSAFAFNELATLERTRQYGLQFKLTTPVGMNYTIR